MPLMADDVRVTMQTDRSRGDAPSRKSHGEPRISGGISPRLIRFIAMATPSWRRVTGA